MTGKFVFTLYWLGCIFIFFCCILVSVITIFFLLFHCRSDAAQSNLRTSSYEALMDLIKYSGKDCYVVVQKTAIHILEKLQKIIQLDNVSWLVSSMYSLSLFFFNRALYKVLINSSLLILSLCSVLHCKYGPLAGEVHVPHLLIAFFFLSKSLIRKLEQSDINQASDTIMQTLLAMLTTSSGQVGGVQEDALLTIGVLVEG